MSSQKCKACNEGKLEYCFDYSFGEAETWGCDKCDITVIVPISLERHFDYVDWSCADD